MSGAETRALTATALAAASRRLADRGVGAGSPGRETRVRLLAAATVAARLDWPKAEVARLFCLPQRYLSPSGLAARGLRTDDLLDVAEALGRAGLVGQVDPVRRERMIASARLQPGRGRPARPRDPGAAAAAPPRWATESPLPPGRDEALTEACLAAGGFPRVEILPSGRPAWVYPERAA